MLLREDQAKFKIRRSGKSRIQSASLTVEAQIDQPLMDLLQGAVNLERIHGWATVTQIEDDADTLHHMELKPNKQEDRRGLPLLANILTTIGASESQILTLILLCVSSQLTQNWTAESAILSSPTDQPPCQPFGDRENKDGTGATYCYRVSPPPFRTNRETHRQQLPQSWEQRDYVPQQVWKVH